MEYQKACLASTPDVTKANQQFLTSVVTKFTPEAYNTMRKYLGTMPELSNVISLQNRAQKFQSAGVTVARKALAQKGDFREKLGILAVSSSKKNAMAPVTAAAVCYRGMVSHDY